MRRLSHLLTLLLLTILPLHAEPKAEDKKPSPLPLQRFVGEWSEKTTQIIPEAKEPTTSTCSAKLLDDGKRLVMIYNPDLYYEITQDPKTGLVTVILYTLDKPAATMTGHWDPDLQQLTLKSSDTTITQPPISTTITFTEDGNLLTRTKMTSRNGTTLRESTTTATKKE